MDLITGLSNHNQNTDSLDVIMGTPIEPPKPQEGNAFGFIGKQKTAKEPDPKSAFGFLQ